MSTFSSSFFRAALAAALGIAVVLACGPFFGIEVLQNRQQVLLAPPSISFETELKALVPPPQDKLPVVEAGDRDQEEPNRATVEARELPPIVLARVTAMREQTSGDTAYGLGEGLPPAVRQYTAGAISFFHGQIDAARAHFQAVLSLPDAERRNRELWAHFMLGRIAEQQSDQLTAAAQFEATRALVRYGASDELGLAVASFGEQARGEWKQGGIAQAVNLYAQQAAYGSETALNSLVTIAGLILKDKDLLDKGIQDPPTRRLLFICINGNSGRAFFVGPEEGDYQPSSNQSNVDRIVAALERHHLLSGVSGAGILASAAYYHGRFDLAEKLSALEDVPISAWVNAKLALRRGDRDAALRAYEKALKGFQAADESNPAVKDLSAENAVLRVSRGDYLQALDLLYRTSRGEWDAASNWNFGDYWGDVAYLAERVLTIDEFQHYVDHSTKNSADMRLRSVLARRLMRAGRQSQALLYFDDPKIRDWAEKYGQALHKAASLWHTRLTRAEAWFTAARIARIHGLEILGFERAPDFAMWNGAFGPPAFPDDPRPAVDPFQTADERKRAEASKPEHPVRFQYRLTAVDHATKSADLLPASSQAFAAVLCEADSWVIDRQPERAQEIYRRYLRQGAYVSWGRSFGRSCPQPDFAAASNWSFVSRRVKRLAGHAAARPISAGLLVVLALAMSIALVCVWRFRRVGRRFPAG